jgi:hypothetical protein
VLVPDVTIEEAAGGRSTLVAMLVALLGGSVLLVPALVYLYVLFQRPPSHAPPPGAEEQLVDGPGWASPEQSTSTGAPP